MKQPPGFAHPEYPDHVCLLKKALYGMRQAPLVEEATILSSRVWLPPNPIHLCLFVSRTSLFSWFMLMISLSRAPILMLSPISLLSFTRALLSRRSGDLHYWY